MLPLLRDRFSSIWTDSTPGLVKAWETFCKDYNLGDLMKIVHETHGRRLYDTLKDVCGIRDEQKLQVEIERFEAEVIRGGPVALPGVISLLTKLKSDHPSSWTIVTSATAFYAPRALEQCGISLPIAGIVTSNDVEHGKPHPDPYLAGARKCRTDPHKCLVIEDAISGLKSGRNAGSKTLAVCTSTQRAAIVGSDAHPDYVVKDLTKVTIQRVDGGIEVTMDDEA
uniref:Uncharacterized protein n=1 Tax=Moniliophthora roreri TaxID=221103 RepID=A0A0W0F9M1_MONRR